MTTGSVTPTCATCRYWSPVVLPDGERLSEIAPCRRLPPTAAIGAASLWPKTGREDWCGEFLEQAPPIPRPLPAPRRPARPVPTA